MIFFLAPSPCRYCAIKVCKLFQSYSLNKRGAARLAFSQALMTVFIRSSLLREVPRLAIYVVKERVDWVSKLFMVLFLVMNTAHV